MNKNPIIALVGSGVMGEALIGGMLRQNITLPENIHASDPLPDRVEELKAKYNLTGFNENSAAVKDADVVILSVKPQRLDKVLAGLRGRIPQQALVLSIVAGASIQTLSEGLKHLTIVRSMPNTPAQIGEGITIWTAAESILPEQTDIARQLLSALGQEIYVEEESYLDMATALSGSGPAYVFLFMEAMIDAGVHLGFPRRIAEQLVVQTIRGSVDFATKSKLHPATLRNQVTSPGGTSAAALYYLEKAGIRTAISRAIWAAYERSQELGRGKTGHSPESDKQNNGN